MIRFISHHRPPPATRRLLALPVALACLAVAPAVAGAGVGLSVTPTFPTDSTVGQVGLPASLTITNANTGTDVSGTLCNLIDAAPCPLGGEGIAVMGSCAAQGADASCVLPDSGVFAISPVARGADGSACSGMDFAVVPGGGLFGKVRFVPVLGGHVLLPQPGSTCRIDFTVDVLRTPTTDAQPSVDGVQTIPIADASMRSNNATIGFARGSQTGVTVPPVVPPPPPPPVAPPPLPPPVVTPPVTPPAAPPLLPPDPGYRAGQRALRVPVRRVRRPGQRPARSARSSSRWTGQRRPAR